MASGPEALTPQGHQRQQCGPPVAPGVQGGSVLGLTLPHFLPTEKICWVPNRSFEREKFPIILGIQDGRRSLACGTGALPALQLEDVNITELSRGGEETTRFTFFRSYKDGMWRFESAANPGWLLCTSAQSNEPLGLTTSPDAAHIVDFYFQLC
uniref:Interleukin-1 n=1 Tax=Chelydra serpentina TaxID=8475 RepID=A0A8C3S1Z3_CHESE